MPFLKGFDFFTDDATLAIPDLEHDDDEDEAMMDIAREMNMASDAFHFDDDDYGVDYGDDMDDVDPFAETNDDTHPFQGDNESAQPDPLEPTSPTYPENDFLSAFMHRGDQDMLNYFDSTLVKNWAGPEHWKLRRPVEKKPTTTTTTTTPTSASNAEQQSDRSSRRSSTKRQMADFLLPFRDVLNEEADAPQEKVFEPASRKPALSRDVLNKLPDNILPEDIHFSSKLLLQYSLKPAFPVSCSKSDVCHANS